MSGLDVAVAAFHRRHTLLGWLSRRRSVSGNFCNQIGRTYRFESAHHLPLVPDGHKCKNMHGHNYRVQIVISGTLDTRGFVKDFAEIDEEVLPLIRKEGPVLTIQRIAVPYTELSPTRFKDFWRA